MSKSSIPKFSKSASNNAPYILEQLKLCLNKGDKVLEIASGTAVHALCFSEKLTDVFWQPSDLDIELYGLREILLGNKRENLGAPFNLDVANFPQLPMEYDAIYSANCIHIIDWPKVETYIAGAAKNLVAGGKLLLYGPYQYGGEFTTESNAEFDNFLAVTYPGGGIKDFEAVDELAKKSGLSFVNDTPMPSNNQFLIWEK